MDAPTITSSTSDPHAASAISAIRHFDGIVCFGGEDWWYHNRGHYDMRMMRAFAGDMPVLYVNSLGMRVPRPGEGRMFAHRIARKLRSLGRGLHRLDERFAVMTAPAVPGRAMAACRPLTLRAIRRGIAEMGMQRPLAWVACPTAAELLDEVPHTGLVYQRTDRYESFLDVDVAAVTAQDRQLKEQADLVVYCSGAFMDDDLPGSPAAERSVLVDHGVDAERFIEADAAGRTPPDIAAIAGPRVGFVGAIDPHTFDPELFLEVTRRVPAAQFVLVGGSTLPEGWCARPNVHQLGQRTPEEVPACMAACDVLVMPWRRSPWIDACHPVKLKEYLATGRPIVTTPFRELSRYDGLVATAETPADFAAMIERALEIEYDPEPGRARVAGQGWNERALRLRRHLREVGLDSQVRRGAGRSEVQRLERLVAGRATFVVPRRDTGLAGAELEPKPNIADAPSDARSAIEAAIDAAVSPSAEPISGSRTPAGGSDVPETTLEPDTPNAPPVRLVLHAATPARAQELPPGDLPIAFAVVLAGGLRPSPLQEVLDRSPVDWWITPDASVLDVWSDRIRTATAGMNRPLPIRVLSTGAVPAPWPTDVPATTIESDPHGFRGPAGVIQDLARHLPPDRHVLVLEAARHLDASLTPMIADHLSSGAAVTVGRNPDGSPAGIYCIRRDALDCVPVAGYCDLKEQWLPRVRDDGGLVLVHDIGGCGSLPLRTRTDLIEAARVARHSLPVGGPMIPGHLPGPSVLRVVCRGAMVGPEANVLDSIIMPGAYVGAGTTVIRSIVGPETVIPADTSIVDGVHHAGRVLNEGPGAFRAA